MWENLRLFIFVILFIFVAWFLYSLVTKVEVVDDGVALESDWSLVGDEEEEIKKDVKQSFELYLGALRECNLEYAKTLVSSDSVDFLISDCDESKRFMNVSQNRTSKLLFMVMS